MKNTTLIGLVALVAGLGSYYYYTEVLTKKAPPPAASAQARPPVSVITGTSVKKVLPIRIDSVGTVQAVANINLRPRIDSQVVKVHVEDGALVKEGDMLISLDNRQISSQLLQAEGQLAKNKASLDGAKREVSRLSELLAKESTSRKALDDARTKFDELTGQIKSDQANVDNLKVQLSYTEIRAPMTGRLGAMPSKVGAIVRQGEVGMSLGSLIQTAPIYVAFGISQRRFAEIRESYAKKQVTLTVTQIGSDRVINGSLAVLDNTIDTATGNVILRAVFDNKDEALWPGSLVNVRLFIGSDDSIVVPSASVQVGQNGNFIFLVKDGKAEMRPVTAGRTLDNETVIEKGIAPGDVVVIEGQIALNNGAAVIVRTPGAPQQGGRPPPAAGGTRPQGAPPAGVPQGAAPQQRTGG